MTTSDGFDMMMGPGGHEPGMSLMGENHKEPAISL
jgi:hypothetical protein